MERAGTETVAGRTHGEKDTLMGVARWTRCGNVTVAGMQLSMETTSPARETRRPPPMEAPP